jgi:uncharacterized membrane protein YjgN (DUF898 family)
MASPEPVTPAFATFTGRGAEYFRIWAVNVVLTVVTLGIYSAWAKVRRTQYFYRHTHIAGSSFDYRGKPVAILKGRIVAIVLLWLYSLVGYVSWSIAIAILVALALVLPWLLGQSIRFRLANTRWRGLAFGFHGSTADAYRVFLLWPLATLFSLFTVFPLWKQRIAKYQFGHASFGDLRSRCMVTAGPFYGAYVMAAVLMAGLMFAAMLLAIAVGTRFNPSVALTLFVVVYVLGFVGLSGVISAHIQQATWNAVRIGEHRVFLRLDASRLAWIQVTNLLLTIITFGFYRPFAQLRVAGYYATCIELAPGTPIEQIQRGAVAEPGAAGDATMELFDLDVTL